MANNDAVDRNGGPQLRKVRGVRAWWRRRKLRKRLPEMTFIGKRDDFGAWDDIGGELPRLNVPPGEDPRKYIPPVEWDGK